LDTGVGLPGAISIWTWLAERGRAPKGWLRAEVVRLSGETRPNEEWPAAAVAGVVLIAKALAAKGTK
jgi:hypothetical protein